MLSYDDGNFEFIRQLYALFNWGNPNIKWVCERRRDSPLTHHPGLRNLSLPYGASPVLGELNLKKNSGIVLSSEDENKNIS